MLDTFEIYHHIVVGFFVLFIFYFFIFYFFTCAEGTAAPMVLNSTTGPTVQANVSRPGPVTPPSKETLGMVISL